MDEEEITLYDTLEDILSVNDDMYDPYDEELEYGFIEDILDESIEDEE